MYNLEPIRFWEYFDFISLGFIVITIAVLIGLYYRKNKTLQKTISETVADNRTSSIIFSAVMTIFFPLYYGFLWFWVGYLINAPPAYFIVLIVSGISEMLFVWLPAKGNGMRRRIHGIAVSVVGLAMLILPVLILLYSNNVDATGYYTIYAFLGVTVLIGAALLTGLFKKYTIQFEVAFCSVFLVMMSVVGHS